MRQKRGDVRTLVSMYSSTLPAGGGGGFSLVVRVRSLSLLFSITPAAIDKPTTRRKSRAKSPFAIVATIFPRPARPPVVLNHCLLGGENRSARPSLELEHFADADLEEKEEEVEERRVLKENLMKSLEASTNYRHDDCETLIHKLSEINPYPDLTLPPFLYKGCFQAVKTSFRGGGIDKSPHSSSTSSASACVNLGHACFNVFAPRHLPLAITRAYNHVGVESDHSYLLIVEFSLTVDPELIETSTCPTEPHPPLFVLHGVLINTASFRVLSPTRMGVSFISSTLRIQNPNSRQELELWMKVFKNCNPSMDDRGSVSSPLPPAAGHIDYLYMDKEMRITKGNRGGLSIVKRISRPIVCP